MEKLTKLKVGGDVNKSEQEEIFGSIHQFAHANKFQKTIINTMVGLNVDSIEIRELKNAFKEISHHHGRISKEDIM
jgi:hypothetical protein